MRYNTRLLSLFASHAAIRPQVKAGAVNHHTDTANSVDGIKSCHVIDGHPDMRVTYSELTCSCDSCQGKIYLSSKPRSIRANPNNQ